MHIASSVEKTSQSSFIIFYRNGRVAMATDAPPHRSTAQRSGPSSRPTGSPHPSVMPGRAMTPFRSPLTHTVRVATSRSSSRP
eukprot:COSAG04_NODE_1087_length_8355_cov_4.649467_2_plen_83_part_00